jgi:hypothetical protein
LAKIPGIDLSIFCTKVNMTMINNPEMHGGSSLWLGRTLNGAGQGSIETKKSVRPVRASGRNFDNTIPPIAELQS